MHTLSFKSLRNRLVALEIALPLLRSRKTKYVLPPVLILLLPLLLLLVKGASFCWSAWSKICFVLMRSADNSQICINVNVVEGWLTCIFCARWTLLLSLLIAALRPGGLDKSFFDLLIIFFKSSILSSSPIKVSLSH